MNSSKRCPKCNNMIAGNALYCQHCGVNVTAEAVNQDVDPYLGTTIDNTFVIESILGNGSMGVVYKARHRALDCYVAIKILKRDYLDNRVVLTRFQREAQAASGVQHPNIIRILHYGKTALGAPYIAMECLEGEDLSDIIVRDFPFSQHRIANILIQVTRALDAAHNAKIIHRDLKPANIKIIPQADGTDLVKVLDFGIAKITDDAGEGLTREGAICGTPAFMSPEQVLGQLVTPASDIFSLGSIMYFMLTSKLPFQGSNMVDMAASILQTELMQPSRVRLDAYVDPQLEAICMRCLERELSNRYASAIEVQEALLQALPTITEADSPNAKRNNIVIAAEPGEIVNKGATFCAMPIFDSNMEAKAAALAAQNNREDLVYENRGPASDECTIIDQRAYEDDEEEGATNVQIPVYNEESDLVSLLSPVIKDPNAPPRVSPVSNYPGAASSPALIPPSDLRIAPRQAVPPQYQPNNAYTPNEPMGVTRAEEIKHKKSLFILIIVIVASLCILAILISIVVVSFSNSNHEKPDLAPVVHGDPGMEIVNPAPQATAPELKPWEITFRVNSAVEAASKAAVWTTSFGIVKDSAFDSMQEIPAEAETETQKQAAPEVAPEETPSNQATETNPKETEQAAPETAPKTTEPKTVQEPTKTKSNKTTSSKTSSKSTKSSTSGSGSIKKKLAQAEKAEAAGDSTKACAIYKQLLSDPNLPSEDKLKVQSKVRRCGRVAL